MLNEKQTDWKSRLSDLDSLPGEYSSKDTGWEQLHERLQEKPRRNISVWYWAAAALLLLIAVPFIVKKQSQQVPVKEMVQKKQLPLPVTPRAATIEEQTPVISLPVVSIPPVAVKKQPLPGNRIDKKNSIPVPAATVIVPVEIKNEIAPVPNDTVVALVATSAPPKKKLPVVHINEIGRQEQENAKFATQWQRHSFQIKFLNQENNPGVALPAASANQEPVKLTIPLKN